jgi:hypothetical protein
LSSLCRLLIDPGPSASTVSSASVTGRSLFRPQPVAVTVSGRKRPAQVTLLVEHFCQFFQQCQRYGSFMTRPMPVATSNSAVSVTVERPSGCGRVRAWPQLPTSTRISLFRVDDLYRTPPRIRVLRHILSETAKLIYIDYNQHGSLDSLRVRTKVR